MYVEEKITPNTIPAPNPNKMIGIPCFFSPETVEEIVDTKPETCERYLLTPRDRIVPAREPIKAPTKKSEPKAEIKNRLFVSNPAILQIFPYLGKQLPILVNPSEPAINSITY
ncbi:MAG: hypothetical protein GX268_11685 [Methanomicrobiales archaeon]|nr:hypothetical protein [Methanomicrobiales archaeon]